jgi:cyclic beta-1,2-glucan synthetase
VRENGGQYTHAAVWLAMAFARLGDGDRAVELLRLLNPVEHSRDPAGAERYRVEPYVLAADVYATGGRSGQGGWTWYTGSAAWMYRAWVEEVCGLRRRGPLLHVDPCIPSGWEEFRMHYRHGSSEYEIHVLNPEHVSRGVARVELDGAPLPDGAIPLADDGAHHAVEVRLGPRG